MTYRFVDCHNHLGDDLFKSDIENVVHNAQKVNVAASLVCAESLQDFNRILRLSEEFSNFIVPCLGIHPVQKDKIEKEKEISAAEEHLVAAIPEMRKNLEKLSGVGEIGLDFQPRIAPDSDCRDTQREVFRKQVKFAMEHDLPVNVHSRSAGKPTIAVLKECNARKVLLHAFDGRPSVAMEGVKEGYFFSIPPSIVRSEQKERLVKAIPLDSLLLETDSPALGPDKTKRNVPANITLSCKAIARIKGVSEEEVANITSDNALKLFPKLKNIIFHK